MVKATTFLTVGSLLATSASAFRFNVGPNGRRLDKRVVLTITRTCDPTDATAVPVGMEAMDDDEATSYVTVTRCGSDVTSCPYTSGTDVPGGTGIMADATSSEPADASSTACNPDEEDCSAAPSSSSCDPDQEDCSAAPTCNEDDEDEACSTGTEDDTTTTITTTIVTTATGQPEASGSADEEDEEETQPAFRIQGMEESSESASGTVTESASASATDEPIARLMGAESLNDALLNDASSTEEPTGEATDSASEEPTDSEEPTGEPTDSASADPSDTDLPVGIMIDATDSTTLSTATTTAPGSSDAMAPTGVLPNMSSVLPVVGPNGTSPLPYGTATGTGIYAFPTDGMIFAASADKTSAAWGVALGAAAAVLLL